MTFTRFLGCLITGLYFLEMLFKFVELNIVQAIVDHISDWHHVKRVFPLGSVEISHVEEQVLLVAEALVPLHLVVDPKLWQK